MTRKEAVKRLKEYAPQYSYGIYRNGEGDGIAFDMAIKALEQQSPCDMCEHLKEDCWEMCQFCPAEPKGSDTE